DGAREHLHEALGDGSQNMEKPHDPKKYFVCCRCYIEVQDPVKKFWRLDETKRLLTREETCVGAMGSCDLAPGVDGACPKETVPTDAVWKLAV
ncbi:unnamed protein product, partial [Symbiodinium sp. CCMP2592]